MSNSKKELLIVLKYKSGGGQKGVSLYLALVIMGILLALALGISTILVGQIKITKGMGDSVIAFYAADTGIERELFEKNYLTSPAGYSYSGFLDLDNNGGGLSGAGLCPDDLIDYDDACYTVTIQSISPYLITSIGVFKKLGVQLRLVFKLV